MIAKLKDFIISCLVFAIYDLARPLLDPFKSKIFMNSNSRMPYRGSVFNRWAKESRIDGCKIISWQVFDSFRMKSSSKGAKSNHSELRVTFSNFTCSLYDYVNSKLNCILIDIDYCNPNPCQYGGICTDFDSDYACNCTCTGFGGRNCELGKCARWS